MILGIETATSLCSVGLAEGEHVLAEINFDVKNLHDRVLAGAIQQMLQWCEVGLEQVEAFAISAGPGSFTGLRIGMGVVKGLAFAQNKPVVALNTLLLQAAAASAQAQAFAQGRGIEFSALRIMPVLQSRRGEFYTAAFAPQAPLPVQIEPAKVIAISEIAALLKDFSVLCGNGVSVMREAATLNDNENVFVLNEQAARLSGGLTARIAGIKYQQGEFGSAAELQPLYVQDFTVGSIKS